jgi:putative hemolysin
MKSTGGKILLILLSLVLALVITGCGGSSGDPTPTIFTEYSEGEGPDPFIGIPNPASFYCQEMGYLLDIRDTDGGSEGICTFPDGSECEEWEFLAGSCGAEWSYCQRQGYVLTSGAESATCHFPDGSSCSEYDFFINECEPPQ